MEPLNVWHVGWLPLQILLAILQVAQDIVRSAVGVPTISGTGVRITGGMGTVIGVEASGIPADNLERFGAGCFEQNQVWFDISIASIK